MVMRVVILALALCVATTAAAQSVTDLQATHREGQTFLTFRESASLSYRVYRATAPITTVNALTPIAVLSSGSGFSKYTGEGFVVTDLGAPLPFGRGLLVWTT